jgi:N-acetylglucosamine kinase-like BadF-type ATPase
VSAFRVGLDVGGTKAAVLAEPIDGGMLIDAVIAATEWDAEPYAHGARWLDAVVRRALPHGATVPVLAVGAQGFDSLATVEGVVGELAKLGYPAVVGVNDAALLVPAAGLVDGIGLIAGTGAIGVGIAADGAPLASGGWGWVLGDEAGAAGIVRDATRLALRAHDDGVPDDGLLAALLASYGVEDAERLARAVNDEPTMANWGPHAPAVFSAADAGSAHAGAVIDGAADHLVLLVDQLRRRGAVGQDVVAAGGVIVAQPRLQHALRERLARRHSDLRLHLLRRPPVHGALELARRIG